MFTVLTCPASNSNYAFDGGNCPRVCGLPDDRCLEKNEDGCECNANQYRDGNACVTSELCGCSDPTDGSYHSVSLIHFFSTSLGL